MCPGIRTPVFLVRYAIQYSKKLSKKVISALKLLIEVISNDERSFRVFWRELLMNGLATDFEAVSHDEEKSDAVHPNLPKSKSIKILMNKIISN